MKRRILLLLTPKFLQLSTEYFNQTIDMKLIKKTILLTALLLMPAFGNIGWAQSPTPAGSIQAAFEACTDMRSAIGTGSNPALQAANQALKACNPESFDNFTSLTGEEPSLDGHFIFNTTFVDSLLEERDVYRFAQRYANDRTHRATVSQGGIYLKNCLVRASSSSKYTFSARDVQELAVVTEPGGSVTLRIYDKTRGKWYNDTENVTTGQPARYRVIELPANTLTTLEVEIINTADKDISLVVISN